LFNLNQELIKPLVLTKQVKSEISLFIPFKMTQTVKWWFLLLSGWCVICLCWTSVIHRALFLSLKCSLSTIAETACLKCAVLCPVKVVMSPIIAHSQTDSCLQPSVHSHFISQLKTAPQNVFQRPGDIKPAVNNQWVILLTCSVNAILMVGFFL